jgi:hypothetical protein
VYLLKKSDDVDSTNQTGVIAPPLPAGVIEPPLPEIITPVQPIVSSDKSNGAVPAKVPMQLNLWTNCGVTIGESIEEILKNNNQKFTEVNNAPTERSVFQMANVFKGIPMCNCVLDSTPGNGAKVLSIDIRYFNPSSEDLNSLVTYLDKEMISKEFNKGSGFDRQWFNSTNKTKTVLSYNQENEFHSPQIQLITTKWDPLTQTPEESFK